MARSSFSSLSASRGLTIVLSGALVRIGWIDKSVSPAVGHLFEGLLSLSGTAILATPEFSIVSIIFFDTSIPNTFNETVAAFIDQEIERIK